SVLHRRRFVYSQSDYSGTDALRVGVDQFSAPAAAEKDQRDPLSELVDAGPAVGRTVGRGGRSDAGLYLRSRVADCYGAGFNCRRLAHSPDGNPLWRRLIGVVPPNRGLFRAASLSDMLGSAKVSSRGAADEILLP